MASGTFSSSGALKMDNAGTYGFLIDVAYGPYGIIEEKTLGGHA